MNDKKYCKHCGELIDKDAVICVKCGKQVEELHSDKNIIINNSASASSSASSSASATNTMPHGGKQKNKWISFLLCFFLGVIGAHKFYEGKTGMGILYICTCGLFGIGALIDLIVLLGKPNPYYV
jgi:RNA polymerase subunit RPABC4/transcription elongation factor Spt4